MKTRTMHEEELLKEIQGLPEAVQEKIVRIVRFFRREVIPAEPEKTATDAFLAVCGTWEDDRTVDEQIRDIHESRKECHAK